MSDAYADQSVVYFIQAVGGGPIKIGHSSSEAGARTRLAQCQIGNPAELHITYMEVGSLPGLYVERQLHDWFSEFRIKGEWFDAVPDLAAIAHAIPMGSKRNGKITKAAWDRGFVAGWRAAVARVVPL